MKRKKQHDGDPRMSDRDRGRKTDGKRERERERWDGRRWDQCRHLVDGRGNRSRSVRETPLNPVYFQINNGIVLLKQPKHAGKSQERSHIGQKFFSLFGVKNYY